MKGQIALEQMWVMAFVLVAVALAYAAIHTTSNDSIALARAQKAVDVLAQAANKVHSLGPGSSLKVAIELPYGVVSQNVFDGIIALDVNTSNGTTSVFATTSAQTIRGNISLDEGQHLVVVRVLGDGSLFVGEGLLADPASASYTVSLTGGSQSKAFTLSNTSSNASYSGITSLVSGQIAGSGWTVTVSGLAGSLSPSSSDAFDISVDVGLPVLAGTYTGRVDVNGLNSATGLREVAPVQISVVVTP